MNDKYKTFDRDNIRYVDDDGCRKYFDIPAGLNVSIKRDGLDFDDPFCIRQGDAYSIFFCVKDTDGEIITPQEASDLAIVIGDIAKKYSSETIEFDTLLQSWAYKLTQENSYDLKDGLAPVQLWVNYIDGKVISCICDPILVLPSPTKVVFEEEEE